jgi:hypothetical protein
LHWVTHTATGAAWGYLIGRPVPALLLCAASHVPLDMAPHHDPDSDIWYVVDSMLGVAFISSLAASRTVRKLDPRRSALCGAIGAALPDAELLRKLLKEVDGESYIFPTHNGTLPQMPAGFFASTVSQAALIALSLALASSKMRREIRRSAGSDEREG